MSAGGVVLDLVAAQSPSYRGRGIARHSIEFARAMVQHHPELVSCIAVHPQLPPVEGIEDLSDWLTTEPDWEASSILHISSVFEPEVPVRMAWPRRASATRHWLAVTVYDLIPDIFPDWYLQDPGLRRRWRCCREAVRAADAVLVLSESAKADAARLLGIPLHRLWVIGSAPPPSFRPAASWQQAFEVARAAIPGLEEGFIVYNGAFNPRKNIDRVLEAYASLPRHLVEIHQLVIPCETPTLTRNHYLVMAESLGVGGRLLLPGYVPEAVLVALLQSTRLVVFPSLYEGYGLPVIEAMVCGAPTIAGDNSSLRELLPADARFNASDTTAIARAMARALSSEHFRRYLIELARRVNPSWSSVADRAASSFEALLSHPRDFRPGWRRRPCLALAGLPAGLAKACQALATCDTVGPGGPSRQADAWHGGYDALVGWARDPRDVAAVEALAASWPGKTIVVLGRHEEARSNGAPFFPDGTVIAKAGRDWAEVARQVVDAAR